MSKPKETPWIDAQSPAVVMHYKALLDTNHLGQWSMFSKRDGSELRPTVTIEAVRPYIPERRKKVKLRDGRQIYEPIKRYEMRFRGIQKTWLAGPVSLDALRRLYGPNPHDWIGKQITLWYDPNVSFGVVKTGGIRIHNEIPRWPDTGDPLDAPVDEEAAARIAAAFGEDDLDAAPPAAPPAAPSAAPSDAAHGARPQTSRQPGED